MNSKPAVKRPHILRGGWPSFSMKFVLRYLGLKRRTAYKTGKGADKQYLLLLRLTTIRRTRTEEERF